MKISRLFSITSLSIFYVAGIITASAQFTSIADNFSNNGNLVGSTPDSGVGDWTQIASTSTSALVVSNGAVTILAGSNQNAQLNFSSGNLSSGTIYVGFDLTVASGSISGTSGSISTFFGFRSGTPASGSYELGFGLFRPNATAQGNGALSTTTSQFQFGFGDGTSLSNGGNRWGSISTVDTQYRVVMSWNLDTDTAALWINPTSSSSTSITATGLTGTTRGIYIRQGSGTHGQSSLSDLKVSLDFDTAANLTAVPEPSTYAAILGGIALIGVVAIRRRKRATVA
ncbi:MAG: PEP-CTERM sorting domain-containing protein [Opitutaceae bacterium]